MKLLTIGWLNHHSEKSTIRTFVVGKLLDLLEFFLHLRIAVYYKKLIPKPILGDYILDVGAHKGSVTKLFLRILKNTAIIAFDPLPLFKIKSKQVKFMQVAVGAEVGVAKFYVSEHRASSNLILPNLSSKWLALKAKILGFAPNNLYVESQVVFTTIDQVVEENSIESIYLLKIDTEGAELDVLNGAVKSLQLGIIQNIQFEHHHNDLRRDEMKEISSILSGYKHQKSFNHCFGSITEEFFSLK